MALQFDQPQHATTYACTRQWLVTHKEYWKMGKLRARNASSWISFANTMNWNLHLFRIPGQVLQGLGPQFRPNTRMPSVWGILLRPLLRNTNFLLSCNRIFCFRTRWTFSTAFYDKEIEMVSTIFARGAVSFRIVIQVVKKTHISYFPWVFIEFVEISRSKQQGQSLTLPWCFEEYPWLLVVVCSLQGCQETGFG